MLISSESGSSYPTRAFDVGGPRPRRSRFVAGSTFVLGVALAVMFLASPASQADSHVFDRGIGEACTSYAQSLERFPDVPADGTHAGAIDCLGHWEIVQGREVPDADPVYAPADEVDRAAMASYVARALQRLPAVSVPAPSDDRFDDYATGVHADNVHVLRAAAIVEGRGDGTYDPGGVVTRAQMASYIARAIEFVIDGELPAEQNGVFPDTSGVHQTNIDKLAAIGVVTGRQDGSYAPSEPVSRAAMASFVARALDYLAVRGYLPVAFEIDVAPAADQVPANLNQRIAGTVDDQFGRGYFSAEVRFEVYRDGALVLSGSQISGLGGDVEFRYNAGAEQGDTDVVVACIVDAGISPGDDESFCLDDGEPADGTRATELTFTWGEPAVASTAPDDVGQFFGMALSIDADDNVLGYQTLPSPPIPAEAPVGEFLIFDYVSEANFIVNGRENLPEAEFECAVRVSIEDERNSHLLNISRGADTWNSYSLSTGSDVSACNS
jgi:hypothetical protein